jgi:hypothetical protein
MVLANVAGKSLTDPMFAPIWAEIDRRKLPVLVHPTDPPGVDLMDMTKFDLSWSVGFMFDTTLAITRMIFEGFFDQYPDLKIIASHGGGTLPYLVGRFEKGDEVELPSRRQMKRKPTDYLRHIYYDSITYDLRPLQYLISVVGARARHVRHRLAALGARHQGRLRQHGGPAGAADARHSIPQCGTDFQLLSAIPPVGVTDSGTSGELMSRRVRNTVRPWINPRRCCSMPTARCSTCTAWACSRNNCSPARARPGRAVARQADRIHAAGHHQQRRRALPALLGTDARRPALCMQAAGPGADGRTRGAADEPVPAPLRLPGEPRGAAGAEGARAWSPAS